MPRALPIAKQSKSLEKQPRWRGVGIRNGGVELFKMQDAICSRMYELSWVRHAEVCQTPPVCQTLGAGTPTPEHFNFMNPPRPLASRRAVSEHKPLHAQIPLILQYGEGLIPPLPLPWPALGHPRDLSCRWTYANRSWSRLMSRLVLFGD